LREGESMLLMQSPPGFLLRLRTWKSSANKLCLPKISKCLIACAGHDSRGICTGLSPEACGSASVTRGSQHLPGSHHSAESWHQSSTFASQAGSRRGVLGMVRGGTSKIGWPRRFSIAREVPSGLSSGLVRVQSVSVPSRRTWKTRVVKDLRTPLPRRA